MFLPILVHLGCCDQILQRGYRVVEVEAYSSGGGEIQSQRCWQI